MKTIYKILLVPVIIIVVFAVVSGFMWAFGKLLLLFGFDLLPKYGNEYDFVDTVIVGGWHFACLSLIFAILVGAYKAINELF